MNIKKLVQDFISLYLCRHRNIQKFYVAKSELIGSSANTDRNFFDIDNEKDFYDICKRFNFTVPDADIKSRFDNKNHFCVLTEETHFGCWGWYTTADSDFYVLEIDRYSVIPHNVTVLFHYYTNENYRRKGFYTELLQRVASSCGKEFAIIYAYDTNPASWKAIEKSGFKFVGSFNHKNFIGFDSLIL